MLSKKKNLELMDEQDLSRGPLLASESGRIGYVIAWLLGVPFWILVLVFLIRGH